MAEYEFSDVCMNASKTIACKNETDLAVVNVWFGARLTQIFAPNWLFSTEIYCSRVHVYIRRSLVCVVTIDTLAQTRHWIIFSAGQCVAHTLTSFIASQGHIQKTCNIHSLSQTIG